MCDIIKEIRDDERRKLLLEVADFMEIKNAVLDEARVAVLRVFDLLSKNPRGTE